MNVETELEQLASQRTWRLFAGAIVLALALLAPVLAWVLGVLSSFHTIANTANPTPEEFSSSLFSSAIWGLGIGAVLFACGLVLLGMGLACDLRLKRLRRELDALEGSGPVGLSLRG